MNEKLFETIADIAYIAGVEGYYSGDSRADISDFIWWAKEFEKLHFDTNWGDKNYMLEVEDYVKMKLQLLQSS